MIIKFIKILILSFITSSTLFAQETVYNEVLDKKIEQNEIISKVFSISSLDKMSSVSLQLNGFDVVKNNIYPVVVIKINKTKVFTGTLSDFTFGANNKYGFFELEIKNFLKNGNNTVTIEYSGLLANSYIYVKNISVVQKNRGYYYKSLKDFNYDEEKYAEYLKKSLTLESSVTAIENYEIIKKGMKGIYYGEFQLNPKFCSVKWSKKLNSKVVLSSNYPSDFKSYGFNMPYAYLKIDKTKSFGDNKPPIISSSIANNTKTSSKIINISGRATDPNGIYAVYINNIKADIDEQGYYNLNIPLKLGTNSVKIRAYDDFGNKNYNSLIVVRNGAVNDSPPTLNITYPQQKEITVSTNNFEIIGFANDDNYVSYLQVINNRSVYKIYVGTNQEFKISLNLQKGQNDIDIVAFDETGHKSEHKKITVNFETNNSKPIITLLNPTGLENDNSISVDKNIEKLPIKVNVQSQFPISDVKITYINTPISINLLNSTNNNFSSNISLPLADEITIKIAATDIYNSVGEFTFVVKRRENEDLFPDIDNDVPLTTNSNKNSYVLIIGNSNYDQEKSLFNNLSYVANDTKVMKDYFIKTFGVPSLNIETASNVGTMEFLASINNFVKKIENHPNDNFLVYYSGHGALNKNQSPYFVPTDYNEANDFYGIVNQLVVDSVIYKMLLAAPAKLTVILDMCYSGKGGKGVTVGNYAFDFEGPVVVFTASQAEAYPFSRRNHSLFTYAFLKVIHDTKGNITYKQLEEQLETNIKSIIEVEKLLINQKPKVYPSSVLDEDWKTWKLP